MINYLKIPRKDIVDNNGEIVPPSIGVTELSATQQELLNKYLFEIIINSYKGLTYEKS